MIAGILIKSTDFTLKVKGLALRLSFNLFHSSTSFLFNAGFTSLNVWIDFFYIMSKWNISQVFIH